LFLLRSRSTPLKTYGVARTYFGGAHTTGLSRVEAPPWVGQTTDRVR
jgi:hypothetical protein